MGSRWKKTHCKRGHLLTEDSVYIHKNMRGCKLCYKIRKASSKAKRKEENKCAGCGIFLVNGKNSCDVCLVRKNKHQAKVRVRVRLTKDDKKKALIKLLGGKCKDCGYCSHFAGFEFDHLRDKKYCISTLLSAASKWETVLDEAAKCELVCATCHRIRTFNRLRKIGT